MFHRCILRAGVVLGDPHQRGGQHQAHGAGTKELHGSTRAAQRVVRNHGRGHKVKRDQRQATSYCQTLVQGRHHVLHAR